MYTVAWLALLATTEYACEAASTVGRRQSDTPVPLWGACNYPDQGINGPLPCADGAQCICKDDTYAQCRTQLDGSWTPPGSSWQCQGPGQSPSGSTGGGSVGGGNPGDGNTGGGSTGGGDTGGATTENQPAEGSKSAADRVGGGQLNANKLRLSDAGGARNSPLAAQSPAPVESALAPVSTGGSNPSGADSAAGGSPAAGGSSAAKVGGCGSTSPPGGWDGIASTSYYGWMGSACNCGQQSWQWASSPGVYNGAVNQKLFSGKLNAAGQPNCGSSCGQCYELSTSGFNTYNDGVGSGSTITIQIVDACFSNGDHWCGSTSDDFKDSSDCGVHFDIQTGAPGTGGGPAVGSDGKTWNGGGQIVYYRQTACPPTLSSSYQSDCKCN